MPRFPRRSILMTRIAGISNRSRGSGRCRMVATDAPNSMLGQRNKRISQNGIQRRSTMHFTNGTGITVLVIVGGAGAAGIVADWHLSASPSPANSTKAESPPRVEVVRPRRVTVAHRLQTNASLEPFEAA